MTANSYLTAVAAFAGSLSASVVAVSMNMVQAKRDMNRRRFEERRDGYADELSSATRVEQLLHRVINNEMKKVPSPLMQAIRDANVDHSAHHARVQISGSKAVVALVDQLGVELTSVMRCCKESSVDLPGARQNMANLKVTRSRLVDAMQSELRRDLGDSDKRTTLLWRAVRRLFGHIRR